MRICYESRKGIRKYESASKKYEYSASLKKRKKKEKTISQTMRVYERTRIANVVYIMEDQLVQKQ